MTDHDDFTALRRYTRQEASARLNISDSWLKNLVTQRAVPHQRSGKPGPRQRGVWFTDPDIQAIAQVLPELMTGRQANAWAESSAGITSDKPIVQRANAPDHTVERFAGLRSLRAQD